MKASSVKNVVCGDSAEDVFLSKMLKKRVEKPSALTC